MSDPIDHAIARASTTRTHIYPGPSVPPVAAGHRYVTFVHKSPYATWNPLQAWCRRERRTPGEVRVLVQRDQAARAEYVVEGIRRILTHYGAKGTSITTQTVADNRMRSWADAITEATKNTTVTLDITPSRSITKFAITMAIRRDDPVDVLYLDVDGYRYDPAPFSAIPYNVQTIRSLLHEDKTTAYRGIQFLGSPPGAAHTLGVGPDLRRLDDGTYEHVTPWDTLIVLLNEAAAAGSRDKTEGARKVRIELPGVHLKFATYDLHDRTFRLTDWTGNLARLEEQRQGLPAPWRPELPDDRQLRSYLAGARLLPFKRADRIHKVLHDAAWATRGLNHDPKTPWPALDTNLFYFEFITTLANDARIPTSRIPLVTSSIVQHEISNRAGQPLNLPSPDPKFFSDGDLHRPLIARGARVAQQEFALLHDRCRMDIVVNAAPTNDSKANDTRIVQDLMHYQELQRRPLAVFSGDGEFIDNAEAKGLQTHRVGFEDPLEQTATHVDIDQVAYLIYQLSIGFGRVRLKGLGVDVLGDHPAGSGGYATESIRIRMKDEPWARAYLHEARLRPMLDEVVRDARLWL